MERSRSGHGNRNCDGKGGYRKFDAGDCLRGYVSMQTVIVACCCFDVVMY